MVNNTVKNGKAAGIADKTIIAGLKVKQTEIGLEVEPGGTVTRSIYDRDNEFITIKAYDGGNPNKAVSNEELTH